MLALHLLLLISTSYAEEELIEELFPHRQFACDPNGKTYETEFRFLQDLGRGFVHAEPHRIFFEYYFPASNWVGFSTADQSIEGEKDQCSLCYFENYYPLSSNTNHSNLYPNCIEECLDHTIFVATVNSDEENMNNWDIIEFQISAQHSKKLQTTMYRIPKYQQILELWGSEYSPYRQNAHFERDIITIGNKQYIHARFWRQYDFAPSTDIDEYDESNEWKPFVIGPDKSSHFCFMSIGSFLGGEYPYADDALDGMLPGFYIDTEHMANIHCYKSDDIKVDCGQDWTFLTETQNQDLDTDSETETDTDADSYDDTDTNTDADSADYYEAEIGNIHAKLHSNDDDDIDIYTDTEAAYDDDVDEAFSTTNSGSEDAASVDALKTVETTEMPVPETTTTSTSVVRVNAKSTTSTTSTSTSTTVKSSTSTTSTSTSTTKKTTSTSTTMTTTNTLQPKHGEDCCSTISEISYDDMNCLKISKDESIVGDLEQKWKNKKCGRKDHLPTHLMDVIESNNDIKIQCSRIWAHLTQINKICSKYSFAKKMKLYMHFKKDGVYECFNKNKNECTRKEEEIIDSNDNENDVNFNNFHYDDLLKLNVTKFSKSNVLNNEKEESELAEIEEDGEATISTLAVLGGIVGILILYILYWFCCSYTSKGYRQDSQFAINNGYCDNDIDTEEYDEDKYQLGQNVMKIDKQSKKDNNYKYDVNVHNMDAMPINSDHENMNDAIEVTVNNQNENNDVYK